MSNQTLNNKELQLLILILKEIELSNNELVITLLIDDIEIYINDLTFNSLKSKNIIYEVNKDLSIIRSNACNIKLVGITELGKIYINKILNVNITD